MSESEYLVGYGLAGEFGRFRSIQPLSFERGDRVVVRTHRGTEAGQVLRLASPGHAQFLPNTTVGQLLRPFTAVDARAEIGHGDRRAAISKRAAAMTVDLALPVEILDVEILLDGEHVVLHHLQLAGCDLRPLVSTLAREFDLHVLLNDLSGPASEPDHNDLEHAHACGNCSSEGGCGSCGSGGCGSCSTNQPPVDAAYFAGLREQMEQRRVPLL